MQLPKKLQATRLFALLQLRLAQKLHAGAMMLASIPGARTFTGGNDIFLQSPLNVYP